MNIQYCYFDNNSNTTYIVLKTTMRLTNYGPSVIPTLTISHSQDKWEK